MSHSTQDDCTLSQDETIPAENKMSAALSEGDDAELEASLNERSAGSVLPQTETVPGPIRAEESGSDDKENPDTASETDTGAVREVDDAYKEHDTSKGPQPTTLPPTSAKELPGTPPGLPPKVLEYLDPTPKTPGISRAPSQRAGQTEEYNEKDPTYMTESSGEAMGPEASMRPDQEPQEEIQSIMEQFQDETGAPRQEEIMSPRLELAGPLLGVGNSFPPRKSSLEPLRPVEIGISSLSISEQQRVESPPPVPPKPSPRSIKSPQSQPMTPASPSSLSRPPPPPEPEPDQPFDFHRFLEQLRHKSADPVAKFLRSFLTEFGKKQWMVHEQVKIIGDFLTFIANKMALCDVWREVSDAEFDNAKEGMEKLVMNRLYAQTFSPAIPAPPQSPRAKGRRKEQEKWLGPGRRGQHQEDVERDDILAQKIRIYGWVTEEHLDIAPVGPSGERFLKLAQQELVKIKGYRAPRDKVICILNCCKVIFGLLKNAKSSDTSADSFVPLLIYVVLQANPEHLVSNLQYILRFRNQEKLGGEAGYYLSSLSGAIQFVETLDRTSLTISDEAFEKNVEAAVSAIAEKNREAELANSPAQYVAEKSQLAKPETTPRNSMDATYSSPGRRPQTDGSLTDSEENDAVAGLLKTIQRPLSTIGRIFSDEGSLLPRNGPASTPQPGSTPRLSPSVFPVPRDSSEQQQLDDSTRPPVGQNGRPTSTFDAQEAAARQASAEAAEARRIQRAEHKNVVEYEIDF